VPFAIGMGMVTYAIAVAFYTLLAIWRIRRAAKKMEARNNALPNGKSFTADAWVRVENRPADKIF
jgi:Flp pilus assembly protein TadB